MKIFDIKATEEMAGKRLDKILAYILRDRCSREHIKDLIKNGSVQVDSSQVKPNHKLREGESIHVSYEEPVEDDIKAEEMPLDIIFEDDDIIVLNKGPDTVVHPGAGNRNGTLVSGLLYHFPDLPDNGEPFRPGIVHRLDKDTSGIMVVAKNRRAMRSLAKQFQKRTVRKEYIAVVKGVVQFDNGKIDASLSRSPLDRKKMHVDPSAGKKAVTFYTVIKRYSKYTLVRLKPETGRTHQIRVHMAYLGTPVLGDRTYGRDASVRRQFLHAEKLSFTHPVKGTTMDLAAPMPGDMKAFLEKLETSLKKGVGDEPDPGR